MRKQKPIVIGGMLLLLTIILSNTKKVASTGAPIGSTGAPEESTCAKSGCHTGADINSGDGILEIRSEGLINAYEPGKTYDITVSLLQPGIRRFGFSLVVLDENNQSAGTLISTEPDRTQLMKGSNQFTGRNYITYKFAGTEPYESGLGKWTFRWKAPGDNAGPVKFYVAGVSADNDGTDLGDQVYTRTVQFSARSTGLSKHRRSNEVRIFPNPVSDKFIISYHRNWKGQTSVALTTPSAAEILLWNGFQESGEQHLELKRPEGLSPGNYVLQVNTGSSVFTTKIIMK